MKILIVKTFQAHNGVRLINFERMHVYNVPQLWAREIIKEGYACEFSFMNEEVRQ